MKWFLKMALSDDYRKLFAKWMFLGVLMGILGGVLGAMFHHTLHFVTHVRSENPWLIFLLPVGGLLTLAVYKVLKLEGNKGTNEIIDATLDGRPISLAVAPAIFLATALTHLFGGSAGREGAALQLGGSVASRLARLLHLQGNGPKILIMAGMSAVFAGLFGTPLTATLFCMEFESVGTGFSPALLPCFLAAYTASRISALLGVHAETYLLTTAYPMELDNCVQHLVLAVGISLLGILMCWMFHKGEYLAKKWFPNPWVRITVGGVVIAAMTLAVGDQRFNGAGMDMALKAVDGTADWYSFILKMVFTAVTLSVGLKGGEIVPTFCIGATFGCVFGGLLGLDPSIGAALGLVGLFCCATNSPIASIMLSVEMFGSTNLYLFAGICVVCFVLSGEGGLYASQIIQFHKAGLPNRFDKEDHITWEDEI